MCGLVGFLDPRAGMAQQALDARARWVERLPTVIDLDRYPPRGRNATNRFAIGRVGSPVTTKYLKGIEVPLQALCRDKGTRLVTIGAAPVAL